MRLGRGKKTVSPTPSPSPGKGMPVSPRPSDLETPFNLALSDLKDSPEKETVLCVWNELQKTIAKMRLDDTQLREALDSESTKRSQLELQVAELKVARDRDARIIDTYKKEMKKLHDAGAALCSSDDAVRKLRRRYEDAQEAVVSAGHLDDDAGVSTTAAAAAAANAPATIVAAPVASSVQPGPFVLIKSHSSLGRVGTPLAPKQPSVDKSVVVSLPEKGRKNNSSKYKKERLVHEAGVKTLNTMINAKLLALPNEFTDPRKNYARLFMSAEAVDVEHVLEKKKQDVDQKRRARLSMGFASAPVVSPRVAPSSARSPLSPGKGAATLRGEIAKGVVLSPRSSTVGVDEDGDELDDDEEEEDSEHSNASSLSIVPPPVRSTLVSAVATNSSKRRLPSPASPSSPKVPVPSLPKIQPEAPAQPAVVEDENLSGSLGGTSQPPSFDQLHARKARARGANALRRPRSNSLVDMFEEGYEARLETMLRALKTKSGGRNQHIVNELLSTEEDYLHDLGVILSVFGKSLKSVILDEEYRLIFSNLDQIHSVHIALLADLKSESFKRMEEQDWGAPFIKHATKMRAVYDVYTSNQAEGRKARAAMENGNRDAADILAVLNEKPEVRHLDLKSYLIKPVQRICKYPLLLRELQKSYQAAAAAAAAALASSSSSDAPSSEPTDFLEALEMNPLLLRLEVARQAMGEILESSNDQMSISESHLVLKKLEHELNSVFADESTVKAQLMLTKRQFICEATFLAGVRSSKKRDKPERLRCVLLSDALMVLAPLPDSADEYYLKMVLPLASILVVDFADGVMADVFGADVNDVFELVINEQATASSGAPVGAAAIVQSEMHFFVCAPSPEVKEKWVGMVSVGASRLKRASELFVCPMCGGAFDAVRLKEHTCAKGAQQVSTAPVMVALEDIANPEEVGQWLRADPDRKKAAELAKKGVEKLAPTERKQWESLREMARSEKRRTLQIAFDLNNSGALVQLPAPSHSSFKNAAGPGSAGKASGARWAPEDGSSGRIGQLSPRGNHSPLLGVTRKSGAPTSPSAVGSSAGPHSAAIPILSPTSSGSSSRHLSSPAAATAAAAAAAAAAAGDEGETFVVYSAGLSPRK